MTQKTAIQLLLALACLLQTGRVNCESADSAVPDGVRRYHDGRVIFDLLAALRSNAASISELGFTESQSAFQGDTRAIVMQAPNRNGQISAAVTRAIVRALSNAKDFTLLFTVKQNSSNVGTLLSFTSVNNRRLLELQSAWRKEELRLHYVMSQAANMIHVERLAYQLADNLWHQVALTVSGSQVILLVDCQKIYDRVLYRPIKDGLMKHSANLWLGQRGRWSSYFEGEVQEAMIVVGQHGSLEQCPHTESLCPTCGQHKLLAQAVQLLQSEMHKVKMQLHSAQQRLEQLAQCDCIIRCSHNGTYYEDGQTWDIGDCQECSCQRGRTVCGPKPCPPVTCAFPVRMKGSCCATCLLSCDLHGYVGGNASGGKTEHGMNITQLSEIDSASNRRICVHCQCKDGKFECSEPSDHRDLCPPVDCPSEQQKTNFYDCCPYCEGYDYCSRGHKCSPNADCLNLHNRYNCVCRPGYYGNGFNCFDIDECYTANPCGNHTVCVNTPGSFQCQCQPGFTRDTALSCKDSDECSDASLHRCSINALCTNSHGSHSCACLPGYYGDGFNCLPICQPSCLNGGKCLRPGVCECPSGYHGARCQLDLDECSLGLHRCDPKSECRNLPGSYHCVCRRGFDDSGRENLLGALCRDKNECAGRRGKDFTCSPGTRCINTIGAYRCLCNGGQGGCSTECTYRASPHRQLRVASGTSVRDLIDPCLICSCQTGFLNCTKIPCNCAALSSSIDAKCCPQCLPTSASTNFSCWDAVQKRSYITGSKWSRDCENCYCLNGEIQCHPLVCPSISCPHPVTLPGACCPVCPHADPCRSPDLRLPTAGLNANARRGRQPTSLLGVAPAVRVPCIHEGRRRLDGARWRLKELDCVACECRDGHICCSHDDTCEALTTTATAALTATPSTTIVPSSTEPTHESLSPTETIRIQEAHSTPTTETSTTMDDFGEPDDSTDSYHNGTDLSAATAESTSEASSGDPPAALLTNPHIEGGRNATAEAGAP